MSLHGILGPCTLFFCSCAFFTHRFVTHHLSHSFHTHDLSHKPLSHTHTHHFLCCAPSFIYQFVRHNSSHTTCFTSRSSTTSFVFPSFPVPATTCGAHYWKKVTCGVIRSHYVVGWYFKSLLCCWVCSSSLGTRWQGAKRQEQRQGQEPRKVWLPSAMGNMGFRWPAWFGPLLARLRASHFFQPYESVWFNCIHFLTFYGWWGVHAATLANPAWDDPHPVTTCGSGQHSDWHTGQKSKG